MPDGQTGSNDATLVAEREGTPSQDATFTQADIEKAKLDASTSVKAEAMRFQKEAERYKKLAEASEERTRQMLAELDERELEANADNPPVLSALQERQKHRQTQAELAKAMQELSLKDEELNLTKAERAETLREQTIRQVAARLSVDATHLAEMAKFTNGSPEAIEGLAKGLPKVSSTPGITVDSGGKGGGGSQTFSRKRIAAMSLEEYTKHRPEIEKALREDRIKE